MASESWESWLDGLGVNEISDCTNMRRCIDGVGWEFSLGKGTGLSCERTVDLIVPRMRDITKHVSIALIYVTLFAMMLRGEADEMNWYRVVYH